MLERLFVGVPSNIMTSRFLELGAERKANFIRIRKKGKGGGREQSSRTDLRGAGYQYFRIQFDTSCHQLLVGNERRWRASTAQRPLSVPIHGEREETLTSMMYL